MQKLEDQEEDVTQSDSCDIDLFLALAGDHYLYLETRAVPSIPSCLPALLIS